MPALDDFTSLDDRLFQFPCVNNVNLGGERKQLAGLWYVGLHSQQGDELTQQSSLATRLNCVAEYRIDALESKLTF